MRRTLRPEPVRRVHRPLAAFALSALLVASCLGPTLQPTPDALPLVPCTRPDCLRVVTWNLHAIPFLSPRPTARLRNVATKLREQHPDLVLLQEVWSHAYARQLGRDLADTYRVTTAVGCGRPFPCGGLVLLVRLGSGWVASAPRFIAYEAAAPWYRFREWDALAKKGMLLVQLARDGAVLGIVDTHLQAEYARFGRDYSDLRRRQLEQLAWTLAHSFGTKPVLVGGDFNTAPGERSGLYESHIARLGEDRTIDLRIVCGECGTRPVAVPLRRARWLDYLITRNLPASATVERIVNEAVDRPFSDHDGLLGRIEYAPDALR
jgi:endonuclease/exonuclease/phosphatase family metal-dependent hydrolase